MGDQESVAHCTNQKLPPLTAYKLLMFDLDGTLVDSVPDLHPALNQALREHLLPEISEQQCRDWVGNGARKLVERAVSGTLDAQVHDEVFDQVVASFFKHYHRENGQRARLYAGVLEIFSKLKQHNIQAAVVTNKPMEFTLPLLEQLGIHCDRVVAGDSLPHKKPHPEQLLDCMRAFGLEAKDALMVGDSVNDIEAAKRAGVACVAVSYGYNHGLPIASCKPDYIVDSLLELG